jgi:hypothetical protein
VLLPSGEPVDVYAGMDALPRSTAAVIKGALLHRLELDGIDAASWLAIVCFDTCSTMFGCNAGVSTLLMNDLPSLIANKCISHRKALGFKHAAELIAYLMQTFIPMLKAMGNIMKASDKKNSMLAEQNEADGANTTAVGTVSFTRWDSFCDHLQRLCKDPETFATHCKTFERAGLGGDSDDHILGAGRSDPAALGVYYAMRLREFIATATSMLDFLPKLKIATKRRRFSGRVGPFSIARRLRRQNDWPPAAPAAACLRRNRRRFIERAARFTDAEPWKHGCVPRVRHGVQRVRCFHSRAWHPRLSQRWPRAVRVIVAEHCHRWTHRVQHVVVKHRNRTLIRHENHKLQGSSRMRWPQATPCMRLL